jgi:DnaJ-domain-containing protein 1
VCSACGALQAPEPAPDPFAALGLEPAYAVERSVLENRLLTLTRRMHPDYFGSDAAKRARAEHNTALLNGAYETVSDLYRRCDWLVRHLGGPDEQAERQMPQPFLAEVLEWNETLEEAREGGVEAGKRLEALEQELEQRRAASLETIGKMLTPLPERRAPVLREARRELNAVRYVDRALEELGALRAAGRAG